MSETKGQTRDGPGKARLPGLRLRGRVWWIRYYRDGRRYEESSKSRKEAAAVRLLRLRLGAIEQGIAVTPIVGRLRFDDAVADVETDYTTNKRKSAEHIKRRIDLSLTPFFGGRRMSTITTADVRAYIAKRQEAGAANATINRELAILKRAFTLAVQGQRLITKPFIPMLREDNTRRGFFEREQFEAVRKHLPPSLGWLLTVAYYTGWRVKSELLPLEWRQVDTKEKTIRLDPGTTKNREGRLFVYAGIAELEATFAALAAERDRLRALKVLSPRVFLRVTVNQHRGTERVGPIKSYRRTWIAACQAAGCPGRIPHDLRRTAVRNLERAGVPRSTAMAMVGHKTEAIYRRYAIVSESDLRAAAARLQADRDKTGTIGGQAGTSGNLPQRVSA